MTQHIPRTPSPILPVSVWLTFIVAAGFTGYFAGQAHMFKDNDRQLPATVQTPPAISPASMLSPVSAAIRPGLNEYTISDIVAETGRVVVHLELATKPKQSAGKACPYFFGPKAHAPDDNMRLQGQYASAAGIIIRDDGYILTNAHVVRGADQIRVTLSNGREYMATVEGEDDATDLAVIKIQETKLPTARFGDSSKVRQGEWAIAIGSPFHLRHSISLGIVSALERSIGDPFSGMDLLQTDAAINPGNSGGPLVNLQGEVIGINCVTRTDAQNISFAVPSNTASSIAAMLVKHQRVQHNYIGVKMAAVYPSMLDEDHPRVFISYARPGDPAANAGIRNGDLIVAINGKRVKEMYDVQRAVHDTACGANLIMTVLRNEKKRDCTIKVGKCTSLMIDDPDMIR